MKYKPKFFILSMAIAAVALVVPASVFAATPSLSLSQEGSSDSVRITVNNADPNAGVNLYYRSSGSNLWNSITNVGYTNYSGYFSQVVTLGIGSVYGSSLEGYVTVNGQTSNTASLGGGSGCWYGSSYCGGSVSLSQSNVTVGVGQSVSVTAYVSSMSGSYGYNTVYVSSNSNSYVADTSVSGNQITVTGRNQGSTTLSICSSQYTYGSSQCASLYVTVSGSGSGNGSVWFSPSSVSMQTGQNTTVNIYGSGSYSGSYYLSSNSNSGVVSASVSGNSLYLSGLSSGSSSLTVCRYGDGCGTLYVTVSGGSSGSISFSPSSVSMQYGQNTTVTVYGSGYYSNSYYVSSNSNSGVVSASISGNLLYLSALSSGSSTITVCQNSGGCGSLYVTVGGNVGGFTLSPSSLNLSVGQTGTVTASFPYVYSGNLYISSNSNPSVASASVSGSTVYVYANAGGNTTMSVCYSNNSQCQNLYVTVSGSGSGNLYFSSSALPQPTVGQYYSAWLSAQGGTSPYVYAIQTGNLPSGLTLSSNGQIYGTPQNSQTSYFTVRVSDYFGRMGTGSFSLTPSGVLGGNTYANGTLINENGTIYIVYKNTKTGFSSMSVFSGLGYSLSAVQAVYGTSLANSGYIVTTANASHPWGTWIKSGQTVYFVHEQGLIAVPNYDTFQNNGGQDYMVVAANWYDLSRPRLSDMTYNDYRLR